MIRTLPTALAALSLAFLNPIKPAFADDNAPVTLAYLYQAGKTFEYKTVGIVTPPGGSGFTVTITMDGLRTIQKLNPDGSAVVLVSFKSYSLDMGSGPSPLPNPAPVTITWDKYGKPTSFTGNGNAAQGDDPRLQELIQLSSHVILPDHDVKPGDTWQTQMDDPLLKGTKFTITGTYVGMEVHGGKSVWKVKQEMKPPVAADGTVMSVETTTYLDPKDGTVLEAKAITKGMPGTQYGPLDWTSDTTLLSPVGEAAKGQDTPAAPTAPAAPAPPEKP